MSILVMSCATVTTEAPPREDRSNEASIAVASAPEASPRAATYGELSRELEVRRRELEDLIVRTGDGEATPEQRQQIRALAAQIQDLKTRREQIEQREVVAPDDDSPRARWTRFRAAFRDITNWDIRDGMFRFQVGVRGQFDATSGVQETALADSVGSIDSGLKLRRGRVFAKGRMLRSMDFWVEYDFGEDVGLKNAYVDGAQINEWVADRFRWRVGKFQEPFSIGRMTSSNYAGFMEIGLPAEAFAPGRNVGVMLRHAEKHDRTTWATSITTNSQNTGDNPNNSKLTITGRVTALPLLADDWRKLVHVGVSFSDRRPTGDDIQYRVRPEARFAPFYADTGQLISDRVRLLGVELAIVKDSNWLQSEWIRSDVDAAAVGNPKFVGAYVEVGRFLTGEHRSYDRAQGTFGRVRPHSVYRGGNPFRRRENRGALEIAARYSTVDLTDGAISGGEMRDLSLGLNWYFNDESRVMLNYVRSELRGVGRSNLILLRFQYNP